MVVFAWIACAVPEPDAHASAVVERAAQTERTAETAPSAWCHEEVCHPVVGLSPGTRIDTPRGAVPVEELVPGDLVWTVATDGTAVAEPVHRVEGRDTNARLVEVALSDGRVVAALTGASTFDGLHLGELAPGATVDRATVRETRESAGAAGRVWDVLVGGPTGVYWANGVLLGNPNPQAGDEGC